ncbi:MAG TPA: carbon-nitrogen hydrolase family protein, partial [Fimbriimonadaceae bacterium]|nr:carbon-nitrogen hydrolase family protein [Fimbriimonadaceae bacterium]
HPKYLSTVAIDLATADFERVLKEFEALEPVVVVGLVEREGDFLYNSAVAIRRGKLLRRYRKVHLLRGEEIAFEPGTEAMVFDVDSARIGINICCDLNFHESVERCAKAGAKVLVCPCSNMMPGAWAEEWKPA